MPAELTTYLIGLIPSAAVIIGMIPVAVKIYKTVKKILNRDKTLEEQVRIQNERINELLADNIATRKDNILLRRQNNKLMTRLTNVYHPEDSKE